MAPAPARRSRGRPVHQGAARPDVPRCARLRRRPQDAGRSVLGGYGDNGKTIVPPVLTNGTSSRQRRARSTSSWPSRSSTPPATSSTRAGKRLDKEGKPISLRMFMPDSNANYPKAGAVHHGLVRPARDQGHDPGPRLSHPRRQDPAAGSRRRLHGQLRHRAVGLGRRRRPERAAPDLRMRRDRQLVRQPVLQSRLRQDVRRSSSRRRPPTRARRSWPRCRTSSTTRPSTTSCTTTRTWTRTGPTGSPAGRTSRSNGHAVLHVRHARVHAADRRRPPRRARRRRRPRNGASGGAPGRRRPPPAPAAGQRRSAGVDTILDRHRDRGRRRWSSRSVVVRAARRSRGTARRNDRAGRSTTRRVAASAASTASAGPTAG